MNADQASKEFINLIKWLDDDITSIYREAANRIHDLSKDGARSHYVTGAMLKAVFGKIGETRAEIGVDLAKAPHAIFVHFPTRPHTITAKNGKTLAFMSGGKMRFPITVEHPGYKGDPFVYDAADTVFGQIRKATKGLKLR